MEGKVKKKNELLSTPHMVETLPKMLDFLLISTESVKQFYY